MKTKSASNDSQQFQNAICQKEGTHYVCGFMFDQALENVQLIEKKRPEWQKDKLNGIGGKVHVGEDSLVAMYREFEEETGYFKEMQPVWSKFARSEGISQKDGKPFCIDYYTAVGDLTKVSKTTDEPPVISGVEWLHLEDTLANVRWLVPMAMEHCISRGRQQNMPGRPFVRIEYPFPPVSQGVALVNEK